MRIVAISLPFFLGLATAYAADEAIERPAEPSPDQAIAAAIDRTLALIDLVQEHHIDPPPRHEMLRSAAEHVSERTQLGFSRIRSQSEQSGGTTPASSTTIHLPDVTRRAAACKTREDEVGCLQELWSALRLRDAALERSESEFATRALLRAGAWSMRAKEQDVQEQFQANRYVGIGVALSTDEKSHLPQIGKLLPTGSAIKAGILEGDLIEQIDGTPQSGASINQTVDRLRGPEGSELTLVVRQPGQDPRTVTFRRGVVRIDSVGAPKEIPGTPGVWCVPVARIGASTVHELRALERRLEAENVRALVIDLRQAQGKNEHDAVLLADALLDGGTIGRSHAKNRVQEFTADRDCIFRGWPLAVVVNQYTSGALEWIVAALQSNHRAIVVGPATAGRPFAFGFVPVPGRDRVVELPVAFLERPSAVPSADNEPAAAPAQNARASPGGRFRPWRITPDVVTPEEPITLPRPAEGSPPERAQPSAPQPAPVDPVAVAAGSLQKRFLQKNTTPTD